MYTKIDTANEVPALIEKFIRQGYTKFEIKQDALGQLLLIAK